MDFSTFALFALTTLVVVSSPGPAAITVTAQAAGNGYVRALFGIGGVAAANVVYFALSATGIASLILASHTLFTLIKWVGVGYLAYLGVSALLGGSAGLVVRKGAKASRSALFARGFVVEFANPKALMYFAAILPQFLNPAAPVAPQLLVMGLTTLALDLTVYSAYAGMGTRIARSGVKGRTVRALNAVAGSALLLAAARMTRVNA